MPNPIIEVENLSKSYTLGKREAYGSLRDEIMQTITAPFKRLFPPNAEVNSDSTLWALKDVSFSVNEGEVVGIIGRNGAGKSTLLKILSRITEPTSGRIVMRGRLASLLEVGTGFHPELTGRENIFLNGALLGMTNAEIRRKFDEIVAFSEIEKFLDTPVKRYSSGMYVRLAFAVAAHLEPEILVVDEVLAVGDAEFQKKCLGKMGDVAKGGRTVLFVSHNMGAVKNLCNKAILMQSGAKHYEGDVYSAISKYFVREDNDVAVVRWDSSKAPAIPSVHLIEVGVLSDGKQVGPDVSTELPIQIYIKFKVTKEAKVGTSVLLYNSDGQLIFVSISNHEANWHGKVRPKGAYKSVCEIPPNFLADGRYSIAIGIWEGAYEAGIVAKDVLQIMANEKGFVRGDLPYEIKDVLTLPLMKWYSGIEESN